MRLAIFYPVRVCYSDGKYTEESNEFHLFLPLKQYFDEIDLVVMLNKDVNKRLPNVVDLEGFNLHSLPFCRNGYELYIIKLPLTIFSLTKIFFRHRHEWDAILIFKSYLPNHVCYLLCRIFGKPIVLFVDGGHEIFKWDLYYKMQKFPKKFLGWFVSKYYEMVSKIIIKNTVTIVDSKEVFNMFKNGHKHLYMLLSTIVKSSDITQEEGKIQRDSKDALNLLIVCRVHPQKGLEYLLEAINKVMEFGINVKLTIVGPLQHGNYEGFLRERISHLGLSEQVNFIGSIGDREKLKEFYKNADIFVLPSLSEGSPKVIPEAMACGLPIIATNIASIPDLIQDGVDGILVEPRDVDGLTNALLKLVNDPALRLRIGKAALEKVKELTLEVRIERFANIIKSAIPRKGSE